MKIYTRIVIDFASGAVEAADWYDHRGPVAWAKGGGGGTTTVINQPNPPSVEEKALTAKQVELAEAQLAAIRQQTQLQTDLFAGTKETSDLQLNILRQLVAQGEKPPSQRELDAQAREDEAGKIALETLKRGGAASPEEQRLIGEATAAGIKAGESDIDRSFEDALRQIREELAPSLGLSAGDTPLEDRANLLGREVIRGKADLSTNLRGAEASAKLNLPLARGQLEAGIASTQQQLAIAAQEFQADLRQAALMNRLALSDAFGNRVGLGVQSGLGLATGIPGASSLNSAVSRMAAGRGSVETRSGGGGGGIGLAGIGSVLGGIGGLASGYRAIWPLTP